MHYFDHTHILSLVIHQVGNKINNESLVLSQNVVSLSETIQENLIEFFFVTIQNRRVLPNLS